MTSSGDFAMISGMRTRSSFGPIFSRPHASSMSRTKRWVSVATLRSPRASRWMLSWMPWRDIEPPHVRDTAQARFAGRGIHGDSPNVEIADVVRDPGAVTLAGPAVDGRAVYEHLDRLQPAERRPHACIR